MKLKFKLNYKDFSESIPIYLWVSAILASAFIYFSYLYVDGKDIMVWSVDFWESLFFKGGLKGFYAYSGDNRYNLLNGGSTGTFFGLVPIAIINFPIWIREHFFHVNISQDLFSIFWGRLYSFLSLIGLSIYSYKILRSLGKCKELASWGAFFIFSSVMSLLSVAYAGQNDVFMLFVLWIGIYEEINSHKKRALFWLIYSFCIKPFTMLAILPWWLVSEKNIYKVFRNLVLLLLPRMIHQVIFRKEIALALKLKEIKPGDNVIAGLTDGSLIHISNSYISLYLCFFVGLCIAAFASEVKHTSDIIFWMGLSFGGMILLGKNEFYRGLLFTSFLVIYIIYQEQELYWMMILESLYSSLLLIRSLMNSPYFVLNYARYLNYFWYPLGQDKPLFNIRLGELLFQHLIDSVISSLFFMVGIYLLGYLISQYLGRKLKIYIKISEHMNQLQTILSPRLVAFFRIWIVPALAGLSLYYYYR